MNDSQKWLMLAGSVVCGGLLYLLAPILTPFLVAALLAYLGDPLADRLEARSLSRTTSVVLVFALFSLLLLLALVLLVPLLEGQLASLGAKLPQYLAWLQQTAVPWLVERLGVDGQSFGIERLKETLGGHWKSVGGVAATLLGSVSRSGAAVLGLLVNLLLIPVVTFYLLRDWDRLVANVRELLPRAWEPTIAQLGRDADEMLGAFLRGQLLVMLALGSIYSLGLWAVGLDLALLIGMLAGVVSFVPYLGLIVGITAAGAAMFMQTRELLDLVWVALVFGGAQVLEGTILTPKLVGERIGLHPVAVIFAVLAGGQLFGFFGILLALPAAAVIAVLLRHAHRSYTHSVFYRAVD